MTLSSCVDAQQVSNANIFKTFNGDWWIAATKDEKIGFLYALDDCLTSDASPKLVFSDTWDNYLKLISQSYAEAPSNNVETVEQLFKNFGKKQTAANSAKINDRYGNEFWRAHNDLARIGFIKGYLSCRMQIAHSPKWSNSFDYYLQKMNDLYNADDRNGLDAQEYTKSVASALETLKD